MSFSFETKNELCRLPVQKLCCARAEAYGVLLYCNTFTSSQVRIITGNPNLAARLPRLFHRAFRVGFDRTPEEQQPGKLVFQITDREKIAHIINQLGYDPAQNPVLHINFGILEEECCRASFLRGVFFAGGSITDPLKRYHLELATSPMQGSWRCCCGSAGTRPRAWPAAEDTSPISSRATRSRIFSPSSAPRWRP